MAKSNYLEKEIVPNEIMLADSLKNQKLYWDEVVCHVGQTYAAFSSEWKYYGKAWGWSFVLKSKAKTLCYLIPEQEYFTIAIIFNKKGYLLASYADLPPLVAQGVEASKNNPKNIPYDFKVTIRSDIDICKRLIEIRYKT